MKFNRHLGSTAVKMPVKFQSDWKSWNPNLAVSRLREISRQGACPLREYLLRFATAADAVHTSEQHVIQLKRLENCIFT